MEGCDELGDADSRAKMRLRETRYPCVLSGFHRGLRFEEGSRLGRLRAFAFVSVAG